MAGVKAHWQYARYVARHKWCVWQASRKLGIPWLGLVHDLSKFDPREWGPYVERFYGLGRSEDGSLVPEGELPKDLRYFYDCAWLLHLKRNKHHPDYWVANTSPDPAERPHKILPMPWEYVKEMVADWDGARRAGAEGAKSSTRAWYEANGHRLPLHPVTRAMVGAALLQLEGR